MWDNKKSTFPREQASLRERYLTHFYKPSSSCVFAFFTALTYSCLTSVLCPHCQTFLGEETALHTKHLTEHQVFNRELEIFSVFISLFSLTNPGFQFSNQGMVIEKICGSSTFRDFVKKPRMSCTSWRKMAGT